MGSRRSPRDDESGENRGAGCAGSSESGRLSADPKRITTPRVVEID
jgi:hypothetical protein